MKILCIFVKVYPRHFHQKKKKQWKSITQLLCRWRQVLRWKDLHRAGGLGCPVPVAVLSEKNVAQMRQRRGPFLQV